VNVKSKKKGQKPFFLVTPNHLYNHFADHKREKEINPGRSVLVIPTIPENHLFFSGRDGQFHDKNLAVRNVSLKTTKRKTKTTKQYLFRENKLCTLRG
jgi:hypothetical protein